MYKDEPIAYEDTENWDWQQQDKDEQWIASHSRGTEVQDTVDKAIEEWGLPDTTEVRLALIDTFHQGARFILERWNP